MEPAVERHPRHFETVVEGQPCRLDYRLQDNVMEIDHVGVPRPVEGRGIASALMREAMDTAREEGWRVRAHCSYAVAWLRRHKEFDDLLQ